jgi:hypothetical protein
MATDRLDVRTFGAAGDGEKDDTDAVQKAVDAAADVGGTVLFEPGVYACSSLTLRSHVGLFAHPVWTYRDFGGAVLRLADAGARCLLDLTGAVGVTVNGLCLDGAGSGEGAHGIMVDKPDYGRQEDVPRIERCRIAGFSGDGIHLGRIWCFTIRHCMVAFNGGCGVWVRGWDGFVLDNWLSGNRGAGFGAYEENAAITMTANRIEWNARGGIIVNNGNHYNICNNYLDRSGGPAIAVLPEGDWWGQVFSITGNLINRSGKPDWRPLGQYESAHVVFRGARGLVFSGNTLNAGRDDGGKGDWSPSYGIVYGGLRDSVIQGNVMHNGALEQLMVDLGGHGESVVVRDNPGSIFRPS